MKSGFSLGCAALMSVAAFSVSNFASADESVLFSFPSGSELVGQVQEDDSGNLYGTTDWELQNGTVYRLQQNHRGVWRAKNLHVFNGNDGAHPYAGLALDRTADTLYGVTEGGGSSGLGMIFGLSQTGRRWTESTLHTFTGTDGQGPSALLTIDEATGVLYGTANSGGTFGCGNAFEINPTTLQFNVLYSFQGGSDGCHPSTQLQKGVESGTLIGGVHNSVADSLFLLTEKGGTWKKSILHNFTGGIDGGGPSDLTILSGDGTNSIYGVAAGGGLYNSGVVFRLTRPADKWKYKVIYNFAGGDDGVGPMGIYLDTVTGTLYGTTYWGGMFGLGTLFKLVSSGGNWTKTVLHDFGSGSDGAYPGSRPIIDHRTGLLYGTTETGGPTTGGTVYSATP